jgi:hypothetical protein
MNMGGPMMLGRGRYGEGGAENNCGEKHNFCLAQHFYLLVELCGLTQWAGGNQHRTRAKTPSVCSRRQIKLMRYGDPVALPQRPVREYLWLEWSAMVSHPRGDK